MGVGSLKIFIWVQGDPKTYGFSFEYKKNYYVKFFSYKLLDY